MVIWSPRSLMDLREIWEFIAHDSEAAADRITARLMQASEVLSHFPKIGRSARRSGSRELVVSGTPYILEYRLVKPDVEITRVIHGARKWPP
jgi:toxin ParE1/3/4